MRHKDKNNFKYFVSILCFGVFVNIFVLKRENKREENVLSNEACIFFDN
jgi:hypothetical protein